MGGLVAVEHAQQPEQEERGGSKTQHGQKAKQKQPPLAPVQIATRISQHLSSLRMHGRCCVFLLSLHIRVCLTYDYYDVEFFFSGVNMCHFL